MSAVRVPPLIPPLGLSARLLVLIVVGIMVAEILIWAPSVARFRLVWLTERIASAELASLAFEAAPDGVVAADLKERLLLQAGARGIALKKPGQSILAMSEAMPDHIDAEVDLRQSAFFPSIAAAMETLAEKQSRVLRVMGVSPLDATVTVETVVDEAPLRRAMYRYSRRILVLSLMISLGTAAGVYLALQWMMVRPMKRLTASMVAFREDPEHVHPPPERGDEIGLAQRELADMQSQIRDALKQRERLAALGAAVAKINHDLRNSLATAMLVSDHLARSEDPAVREVTPRLIEAIDRAVLLCRQTLEFANDQPPRLFRRAFRLGDLLDEGRAVLAPLDGSAPEWTIENQAPPDFTVFADRDQLVRVIENLARNAFQAGAGTVRVSARIENDRVLIDLADDGAGLPESARENLFRPFVGAARKGGTGLGLVIARDIMAAHRGDLRLLSTGPEGSVFRIELPSSAPAEPGEEP